MSKLMCVGIGLGSNLGDGEENIRKAVWMLEKAGLIGIRLSSFVETKPLGFESENMFTNCVGIVETAFDPHEVLNILMQTEQKLGRNRSGVSGYEDRIIDLDLLFYSDWVYADNSLVLPHPRLHEREFVLAPLVDVYPDWIHPQKKSTALELLREIGRRI